MYSTQYHYTLYTEVNIGVDQAKVFQELTVIRKGLRVNQGLQLAIADLEIPYYFY